MIVLASQSPRRKEILSFYTKDFITVPSKFDESMVKIPSNKIDYPEILSYFKALEVYKNGHSVDMVIGSDTVVIIKNEILGKPKDKEDAFKMLKLLQGKKHIVATGVTILYKDKVKQFTSVAKVYFDKMTNKEIEDYIETGEPMDKAGAYAIQGIGGQFVNRVIGDFYTVMGLPYYRLVKEIKRMLKD